MVSMKGVLEKFLERGRCEICRKVRTCFGGKCLECFKSLEASCSR